MPTIGGLFEAQPGEVVAWSHRIARPTGLIPVNGRFFLTNARLLFAPSRTSFFRRGSARWEAALGDIASIGPIPGIPRSSRLSRAVRIELRGKPHEDFFTNVPDKIIEHVRPALSGFS